MNYRKANINDIDDIMVIIEDGRRFLKPQGGDQWQNDYPNKNDILLDISDGVYFVLLNDDDDITAGCALTYHEDEYDTLKEGHWLSDLEYMVMHRCAVKERYRGLGYGNALFELFELEARKQEYYSLRIDTHENNKVMRHLLKKNNFIECGKAILKPNKDRLVFEKVLENL